MFGVSACLDKSDYGTFVCLFGAPGAHHGLAMRRFVSLLPVMGHDRTAYGSNYSHAMSRARSQTQTILYII